MVLRAADDPNNDGLVVFADYQTAGRGRLGRSWLSPRGASILCSTLLVQRDDPGSGCRIVLLAAVAACEAVRQATNVTPAIRWPNDLIVANRKLGGILVESHAVARGQRAFVVGVGINCVQQRGHFLPELQQIATSLELESDSPIDRLALARRLVAELDHYLGQPDRINDATLKQAWLDWAEPMGRRVRVRQEGEEFTGVTVDIDPANGLIIQLDEGARCLFDPVTSTLL